MSNNGNDDRDPSPGRKEETQLGFDADSLDENSRDLEPVFEDFETEEPQENTFENSRYSAEYEEDTLDYDIDPESLMEEEEEFELDLDAQENGSWQDDDVETEPEPELTPLPEPNVVAQNIEDWPTESSGPWPIGLIAVAVIALLLLSAGGYGVMQQRATMQEEIRKLQADAATSVNPSEIAAGRETQRRLDERNTRLQSTNEALEMEIRLLQDTARGLESQLEEMQGAAAPQAKAAPVVTKPRPAPTPKPAVARPKPTVAKAEPAKSPAAAVTSPTASTGEGNWFVNFSSYGTRQTADSWVNRLKPASGRVIVAPTSRNGDTLYRVRVVELDSQNQAEAVARALEKQYNLPKLWVGEQ